MLVEAQTTLEWITYLMQKALVQVLLALKSTALTSYGAVFLGTAGCSCCVIYPGDESLEI